MTCFICACVKIDDGQDATSAITLSASHSQTISYIYTKSRSPEAIVYNMSMDFFRTSYTEGANAEPWRNDAECLHSSWEWRRKFRMSGRTTTELELLCTPEDVEYCCEAHERDNVVCKDC